MAKYSSFFEQAGIKRINAPPSKSQLAYRRKSETLEKMGFNIEMISSKSYNISMLKTLEKGQIECVRRFVLVHCFTKGMRKDIELESKIAKDSMDAIA